MKVYKCKLEDDYRDYYVIANSFDNAEYKILQIKMKEQELKKQNIFTNDGSLRPDLVRETVEPTIVVKEITMVTDNIIQ